MSKRTQFAIPFLFLLFISTRLSGQFLPERGEWLHFSYSHLTLLNAPEELEQKWNSQGWQIMFMRENLLGRRSHWGIGYGLGFSTNYWHTNLAMNSNPATGNFTYSYIPQDSSYSRNRFSATYVDIPVEFRFRSNSNNKGQYFRFYFGGLVGYRINSFSNFKRGDYDVKYYRLDAINNWHYGVFVRTGFWLFNFYAYYGLNPVFNNIQDKPAPEGLENIHSLSLGLSISL